MTLPGQFKTRLFADGADVDRIAKLGADPRISGFTTNPTLMRKAGVTDYRAFAREVLRHIGNRPISFEVFSDDFAEMECQAHEIASWGPNVNVKIPVTNTRGVFSGELITRLSNAGIALNVTALMTAEQVQAVVSSLAGTAPAFVSVFAGRVADTGRDPVPIMRNAVRIVEQRPGTALIWASPRELLNVFQAEDIGCHVITATTDILAKLPLVGKDLTAYSLETVEMFRNDALRAGYDIAVSKTPLI